VASLRNELAINCKYLARFDEAEVLYRQARATLEAHLGSDHPEVAGVWHNQAGLAHARGDHRRAAALGRRGLAIRVAALGEDHPELATTLINLAVLERAGGQERAAGDRLRRAIRLLEPAVPHNHPTLVAAREEHEQLANHTA
jgi:hypothetical protein